MPGLDPRRADLAVAGAVLLDTILRRLGADEITLCDLALREGLVLDYIHRNTASRSRRSIAIPTSAAAASSSSPSAAATGRSTRSRSRGSRSRSSTRRARVHGLDRSRARVARVRARCCTTSACTSATSATTSHSYYLIKNGDLRGFEPRRDRDHRARRALSSAGDAEEVARRLRRLLKRHAAPDGPDAGGDPAAGRRPRPQPRADARRRRRLHDRGDDDLLQLRTTGDAELELWAAHRHAAPFERMLGKPLRFEVAARVQGSTTAC